MVISFEDYLGRLASGEPLRVIDVRSRTEFRQGHLPGALHLPFWQIPFKGKTLCDGESLIVLYCEHGPRAHLAQAMLGRFGCRQVACLDGHMARWRRQGRPLVR